MNNQIQQKTNFINEIDLFLEKLNVIDKNTEYTAREPEWWCEMSDLQRYLRKLHDKLKK